MKQEKFYLSLLVGSIIAGTITYGTGIAFAFGLSGVFAFVMIPLQGMGIIRG